MKIKFLGAAGTVTGSKIQVEHHGYRLLVDCGLYQGSKEWREMNRQNFEEANKISSVILTHAHLDHTGYLPKLVRSGFKGNIFCTHATAALTEIILRDSAKLQEEDAIFANRSRHSKHFPAEPLYTIEDAEQTIEYFRKDSYHNWIKLSSEMSFRFIRAGHILGSAFVQIQYSENSQTKILTFTGDMGNGRSEVIKEPESILETDFLISESTYGDRAVKKLDEVEFSQVINKVIGRGGTILVPAFSIGRTQEILFILRKLQKLKLISDSIPIYLDSPMAQRASKAYVRFPAELKIAFGNEHPENFFKPTNFRITEGTEESMLLCMSDQPKIVMSASGMLQGGRILHHLKSKLPDERSAVVFTGYQARGTKGLLLKNGLRKIRIHHQEIDVEAEIYNLDSLSAHADSDDLMKWYSHFKKPPLQTFLNHGEDQPRDALKYRIETELGWKVVIPNLGDEFVL